MSTEYTVGALTKALKKAKKRSKDKSEPKAKKPLRELFAVSTPVVRGSIPFKEKMETEISDVICETESKPRLTAVKTKKRKLHVDDEDSDNESIQQPRKRQRRKMKQTFARDDKEEQRTIFIGNLPNTISQKKVLKHLKKYGEVESLRFRSMALADPEMSRKIAAIKREFHPGRHNMNAYARFKLEENAKDALALNGMSVKGFQLRVDMASGQRQHNHRKSVFLGNLPFNIEEDSIRTHFEDCGVIENVRVIRDSYTGIGKGFGYITFQDVDGVELALQLNGTELRGRKIRVARSQHQEKEVKATADSWRSRPQDGTPKGRRTAAKFLKSKQPLKRNGPNAKSRMRKAKLKKKTNQGKKD